MWEVINAYVFMHKMIIESGHTTPMIDDKTKEF
jgi:hypothetical protein